MNNLTVIRHGTYEQKAIQFRTELNSMLKAIAEEYRVDSGRPDFGLPLLIQRLKQKFNLPVIILIDEYDAPIQIAIYRDLDRKLGECLAEILNDFFLQIKANSENLGFAWITGLTKIEIGLFMSESALNSFVDMSNDEALAAAAGFTIDEIKSNFESHLKAFSNKSMTQVKTIQQQLIETYGGYRFSINNEIKVFNPMSVIKCLGNQQMNDYWGSTVPTTYIIQTMYKNDHKIDFFENLERPREFLFRKRDMIREATPIEVHMFLAGHLTIKKYVEKEDICVLTYPNMETRLAILQGIEKYVPSEKKEFKYIEWLRPRLWIALENGLICSTIRTLNYLGFPNYSFLLNGMANEKVAERRLVAILRTIDALSKETEEFFSSGSFFEETIKEVIDITTHGFRINYAIEVKCGSGEDGSILNGIKKQITCALKTETRRIAFNEALNVKNQLFLLTLHFTETWGGHIDEWVLIPFEAGKLRLAKMKTSSQILLDKVKNMTSEMKIE